LFLPFSRFTSPIGFNQHELVDLNILEEQGQSATAARNSFIEAEGRIAEPFRIAMVEAPARAPGRGKMLTPIFP
jgi:hypothetical protein